MIKLTLLILKLEPKGLKLTGIKNKIPAQYLYFLRAISLFATFHFSSESVIAFKRNSRTLVMCVDSGASLIDSRTIKGQPLTRVSTIGAIRPRTLRRKCSIKRDLKRQLV